jgi:hypothetical protein
MIIENLLLALNITIVIFCSIMLYFYVKEDKRGWGIIIILAIFSNIFQIINFFNK